MMPWSIFCLLYTCTCADSKQHKLWPLHLKWFNWILGYQLFEINFLNSALVNKIHKYPRFSNAWDSAIFPYVLVHLPYGRSRRFNRYSIRIVDVKLWGVLCVVLQRYKLQEIHSVTSHTVSWGNTYSSICQYARGYTFLSPTHPLNPKQLMLYKGELHPEDKLPST